MSRPLAVVILAAGKGTRMDSSMPKVLHHIGGKPMISHVVDTSKKLGAEYIVPILGYKHELVNAALSDEPVHCALQKEQLGTAHAVMQSKDILQKFNGNILILSGDVPLISFESLTELLDIHNHKDSQGTILTTDLENPTGYGRVIRKKDGNLEKIVEETDANDKELDVKEINSGIYVFKSWILFNLLPLVGNNNSQKEYYLPDVLNLILKNENTVSIKKIQNFFEIQGVNDIKQLDEMNEYYENN